LFFYQLIYTNFYKKLLKLGENKGKKWDWRLRVKSAITARMGLGIAGRARNDSKNGIGDCGSSPQ